MAHTIKFLIIIFLLGVPQLYPSYETQQAMVRLGNTVCSEEKEFIAHRKHYIKKELEQLLSMSLAPEEVPTIALCCSGGGFRAMISTLGSLNINVHHHAHNADIKKNRHFFARLFTYLVKLLGIDLAVSAIIDTSITQQSLGLLDICTYAATVSGSSWALSGLIAAETSIDSYINYLSTTINTSLFDANTSSVIDMLMRKYSYGQPVSLIDIYGGLLSQKLLNTPNIIDKNTIYIDSEVTQLANNIPFPIYTAITGNTLPEYHWIEFTPFEIGSSSLNTYIPTWAFGRKFKEGVSQDFNPPQTLGFCMGIWGSAMSINIQEFYLKIVKPLVGTILTTESKQSCLDDVSFDQKELNPLDFKSLLTDRLSPALVFNWNFELPGANLFNKRLLSLIDGGIEFNLPLEPLLNRPRSIDILIILDTTSVSPGSELLRIEEHAKKNGFALPPLDHTAFNQRCSIHKSTQKGIPTLIYMPLIKHPDYNNGWDPFKDPFTSTYNFIYSLEQIMLLSGLATYNMSVSMPLIKETIKDTIQMKKLYNAIDSL